MLNSCTFIGTLGRDPEKGKSANFEVANFSMAVTEKWKDKQGNKKEDTQWINCVVFGALSNVILNYTKKGSKIYVEAKFKLEKYTGKDGAEKQSAKFHVSEVILLGDSRPSSKSGNSNNYSKQSQAPVQHELDDDIPF